MRMPKPRGLLESHGIAVDEAKTALLQSSTYCAKTLLMTLSLAMGFLAWSDIP